MVIPVRRHAAVLLAAGVLLLVVAIIERFALVPDLTKLPATTNITLTYSGEASVINTQAAARGSITNALVTGVPATLSRHVHVLKVHADDALLADDTISRIGTATSATQRTYLVDRSTLEALHASQPGVTDAPVGCLTASLPLSPKPDDGYRLYDTATGTCAPVRFDGATADHGREAYQYTIVSVGTLADQNLLRTLPKALPRSLVLQVAQLLPSGPLVSVAPALLALPATVPLTYQSSTMIKADIDQTTGLAINEQLSQQVTAGITVAGKPIPLLPVLSITVAFTPSTVSSMAQKASSAAHLLTVLRWVIPVALLVAGVVLIVIGIARRRQPSRSGRNFSPVTPKEVSS